MPQFFDPTPDARAALDALAAEIPGIQQTLIKNHAQLQQPDRGAHEQQLAGGRVLLSVADRLPAELDGLGLFRPRFEWKGIGRISTGLGCPHAETDPDFLGVMLAFRAKTGQRVDFVGINDPTAPTNTPAEFMALLKATADAAGTESPFGNPAMHTVADVLATQVVLLASLTRHAGLRAPAIATHVTEQTLRTVRSASAVQQYSTGVVRSRHVLGKFTLVPDDASGGATPATSGAKRFTTDWAERQRRGPIAFHLYWIPFLNPQQTPLDALTRPWAEAHRVDVGRVTFPQTNPATHDAKMMALLAAEMGANPGNWIETDGPPAALPSTEYTAARSLVYKRSQAERGALADDSYQAVFEGASLPPALEQELVRRFNRKRAIGHDVPAVGDIAG